MRKFIVAAAALSTLATALAAPGLAQARHRYHRYHQYQQSSRYNYDACRHDRRRAANQGTLVGALGGGLLGNVVAGHGSKTGGTLIGAGVGAVAGHEIARNNHHC